jgi:amidohydrolase
MHPELSNQEERTGRVVAERLRALGLEEIKTGWAGHGVTALLRGGKPGPVVAWRADMDALPIDESDQSMSYRSRTKGVKHACGHDAHMAIALGVAEALVKVKSDLPGTVKFVFQPAEEGVPGVAAWGAKRMIAEGALDNPKPAAIFAYHVGGMLEVGTIGVAEEAMSSAVAPVEIEIKGKRAHGAYPYQGIDAVAVASQCVLALQTIHSRQINAVDPSVFTLGTIKGGERRNVLAETVRLTGGVRAYSDAAIDLYEAKIRRTLDGCTGAMGATYAMTMQRDYSPVMNSPTLNAQARPVLEKVFGANHISALRPGMWGEDFSLYQRLMPGIMLLLGTGNKSKGITAGLHTKDFDIDEAALVLGVEAGARMLVRYLEGGAQ